MSKIKYVIYRIIIGLAPQFFFKLQHFRIHRKFGSHYYWANLNNPKTFNEHILSRKLKPFKLELTDLVDKYHVKSLIEPAVGASHVIKTYFYMKSGDTLDLAKIQFPCIMKPTHLSGHYKVFKDIHEFNSFDFERWSKTMFKLNLFDGTGELQYRNLTPGILFEELLETNGEELKDYKFFCFNGDIKAIQVDFNRSTNHSRTFMTPRWENLRFSSLYKLYKGKVEKPQNLSEMLGIAETLSKGHTFVRVDLYNLNGKVYFGELTFDHGSGYEPFTTKEWDLWLGSFFNLES